MIRDFWSGPIRANTVVVGIAASSWSSSSASTSAPLEHARADEADLRAHLGGDQAVVAGDDLDRRPPAAASLAMELPASAFGGSAKVRKPSNASPCSSARLRCSGAAGRPGGHGDHPWLPRRTAPRASARAAVGDVHAPVQHHLGSALGDEQRLAGGVLHQDRGQLPLVVEGQDAEPRVGRRLGRRPRPSRRRAGGRPQGLVQRVPADRPVGGDGRLVAHEPEEQGASRSPSRQRSRARSKVILPSVSVPVLSVKRISMFPRSSMATSRFTSTFFAASAFEPGGEADRDDGRHHLGRDADGDGEREEQRVDERPRRGRR